VIEESASNINEQLKERLRFETLIADLSSRFVSVPADRVDREIEDAQRAICECLDIEHSSLWQASESDPHESVLTHLYRHPDLRPAPERMTTTEFFPWAWKKLMAGEIVCVPRMADTPPESARDKETWQHFGIKSALGIPLSAGGGGVFGALSFEATSRERDWSEPLQKRLQLIAEVFANAIDRKYAEQKLRESEARLSLAAKSANAGLWTLEPKTGQVWGTEKAFDLFGLDPSEGMSLDKVLPLVQAEDREMLLQSIVAAMQTGEDAVVEYRILKSDGSNSMDCVSWSQAKWNQWRARPVNGCQH